LRPAARERRPSGKAIEIDATDMAALKDERK